MNDNGDKTVEDTCFQYPFDTFPPVISKAKPHFVVCDTGRKLDLHFNRYDGLHQCSLAYTEFRWKRPNFSSMWCANHIEHGFSE